MMAECRSVTILVIALLGIQSPLDIEAARMTHDDTGGDGAASSAWRAPSLNSDNCQYTELAGAAVRPGPPRVSSLKGKTVAKGMEVTILETFQSDFPPGSTSLVPEGLTGTVIGRFTSGPWGNGAVVRFSGGDAGIAARNFDKLGGESPSVVLEFCGGRHVELREGTPDYKVFAGVQWEDPSLAGGELTPYEAGHIAKYTGSYAYADNVAKSVLNGLPPKFPDRTSGRDSWESKELVPLTKEVLAFDITFATALNKINSPTTPVSLYRGAWETPETLEQLRQTKIVSQSRFMSSSLSKDHACNFLSVRNEPPECRFGSGTSRESASGCIYKDLRFPVFYELQTTQAKDVQKWSRKEQEFLTLPNVPFEVVSIDQVPNDIFYEMSSSQLESWLSTSFPEVAQAVQKGAVSGKLFVTGIAKSVFGYVNELLGYDWPYEKHTALWTAMGKGRFSLRCADMDKAGNFVDNTVPYYYRVVLGDPAA